MSERTRRHLERERNWEYATDDDLRCPDCNGTMRLRKNGQTGDEFWGCKKYPDCRGTRKLTDLMG